MSLRSALVYSMLLVLGVTGVAVAVAALKTNDYNEERLYFTALACAIATAIMLPFSTRADRRSSRFEGIAGMATVLILYSATLAVIWGLFEKLGGYDLDEKVCWTIFYVAVTTFSAAMKTRLLSAPAHRLAGVVGISLSAAVLIFFLLGTWWTGDGASRTSFDSTGLVLASTGLLGTIALFGWGDRPRHWWRWIGVAAAVAAAACWLIDIWSNGRHSQFPEWLLFAFMCVAAVIAHWIIVSLIPLTKMQRWIRVVTALAALATGTSVALTVWTEQRHKEWPMSQQTTDAAGILTCCGTLSLLILARFNRGLVRQPVLSEIRQMTIVCPGCNSQELHPMGTSACPTCGLKFNVSVEEPRCPQCDYLLYKLASNRCPECGLDLQKAPAPAAG